MPSIFIPLKRDHMMLNINSVFCTPVTDRRDYTSATIHTNELVLFQSLYLNKISLLSNNSIDTK